MYIPMELKPTSYSIRERRVDGAAAAATSEKTRYISSSPWCQKENEHELLPLVRAAKAIAGSTSAKWRCNSTSPGPWCRRGGGLLQRLSQVISHYIIPVH